MAKRIGIIYCKRINETSCIGCAKCYKAAHEKAHNFAGDEEIEIVFKTHCGDCPGLVLPRLDLQLTVLKSLGVEVDELYWGTCVQKATAVMSCPMNVAGIEKKIDAMFNLPITMGTHDY
jgi:predicted metal-binding protein